MYWTRLEYTRLVDFTKMFQNSGIDIGAGELDVGNTLSPLFMMSLETL